MVNDSEIAENLNAMLYAQAIEYWYSFVHENEMTWEVGLNPSLSVVFTRDEITDFIFAQEVEGEQ